MFWKWLGLLLQLTLALPLVSGGLARASDLPDDFVSAAMCVSTDDFVYFNSEMQTQYGAPLRVGAYNKYLTPKITLWNQPVESVFVDTGSTPGLAIVFSVNFATVANAVSKSRFKDGFSMISGKLANMEGASIFGEGGKTELFCPY